MKLQPGGGGNHIPTIDPPQLTIHVPKARLAERGLEKSGLKHDLIARLIRENDSDEEPDEENDQWIAVDVSSVDDNFSALVGKKLVYRPLCC